MFKADTVDGVIQLNINAQIVAVQLQLVTRTQTCVFINVYRQCGDSAIELEFPVSVLGGIGLIFNLWRSGHCLISMFI